MNAERDLIQDISKYIQGKLSEAEIIDLWLRLLKYPEWIFYLQVEIAVKGMYRSKSIGPKRQV